MLGIARNIMITENLRVMMNAASTTRSFMIYQEDCGSLGKTIINREAFCEYQECCELQVN